MVQLSPSSPDAHGERHLVKNADDYKHKGAISPPPTSLSSALTPLQAYETYLDNGLVSLKHKIRNIEKKKVKLEDYRERLNSGECLNQDQQEAVDKYEEVIHNLEFAKELQKTFSALNQELLKAQKKTLRRENVLKVEAEKKRLRTVLQIQYVMQSFGQNHVQKDFNNGMNGAMSVSSKELDSLAKFSKLLCPKRQEHMSLEDQMDQLSVYFWNLLEGADKTVAGTNYKYLKDLVARLLDCVYFESIPAPPCEKVEPILKDKRDVQNVRPKIEAHQEHRIALDPSRDTKPFVEYVKCDLHPCTVPVNAAKETKELKPVQTSYTKTDVLKPWGAAAEVKVQEPKRWPSPQPMTTPLTKPWEAISLRQTCPQAPRKCEAEPKEKRECVPKLPPEVKPASSNLKALKVPAAVNGQSPMKKRELPSAVRENGLLPSALTTTQSQRVPPQSAAEFCSSPNLPKDPELRKQKLEDLIDEIKGTYNFMQDSFLEFEYPSPKRSALLPLQSTPIVPSELQQMSRRDSVSTPEKVAPSLPSLPTPPLPLTPPAVPAKFESKNEPSAQTLSEPETAPVMEQSVESPNRSINPKPEDAFGPDKRFVTNAKEQLPERNEASVPPPLPSEQLLSPKTPTNTPVLHLHQEVASMSPQHAPTLQISSSPFQGMQAVFKVHPPLPPRKEPEIMNEVSYSPEYHQTFSTVSTQTLPHCPLDINGEQTIFIHEPLSSSPYTTCGINQVHVSCASPPSNLMPRMAQSYANRGSVRGTNRGRVITNGFRCQSPYKGAESFRGAHCITNAGYGHAPCPGRDFNTAQLMPRDASSHLNHKRGTITSARPNSRGWSESSQTSSPERDEVFHTIDSGHGDSRNLASPDISMTSQTATILPVHVYPLPQQMRVAFSAARTSNFAPGTLDQPIVFDLLLNNLGDTFDFQLGRFMCPVNGTYVFIFHMLKLAVNVPLYVNLMKNDEVMVSAYANDGAPDHETASNHAVLQLFHGDQIWLRLHRGAIYGSSWKYSTFSGYLLYQD
ncbi:caprin-2 [Pelodytes ibericus]